MSSSSETQLSVSTSLTTIKKPVTGQKPVFIHPITSCSVPHGEVARFHACVSGLPKPEISWFHQRQPVGPSKNVVFHFDEVTSTATLIIVDAFAEHAGQYTCRAANAAGEAACSATLSITTEEEGKTWVRWLIPPHLIHLPGQAPDGTCSTNMQRSLKPNKNELTKHISSKYFEAQNQLIISP